LKADGPVCSPATRPAPRAASSDQEPPGGDGYCRSM
jgi:hypothetical protein